MKKELWWVAGIGLVALLFIWGSYLYDQRFHGVVVEHKPETADTPGGSVYSTALSASEEGKALLRIWETNTRRLSGKEYDLEITLNDAPFFRALAALEGKGGKGEETVYASYRERYLFDRNLVFTVMLHSAMGELFELHPEEWMVLRVDGEAELVPKGWRESNRSVERHRRAVVTFGGDSIVSAGQKGVVLVFKDPGKGIERTVKWDLDASTWETSRKLEISTEKM